MTLFFSLLPLFLIGNLHCMGMCGPLVMLLGKHPSRGAYFLGRTLSFSLAGFLSSTLGILLNLSLQRFYLTSICTLFFGGIILLVGGCMLLEKSYPGYRLLAKATAGLSQKLALLIHQRNPFPIFLFGFLTLLLPCGQTLVVFSALALAQTPFEGLLNGFLFAIFTSPSLFFSMYFGAVIQRIKKFYPKLIGCCTLLIGILAFLRAFADIGWIPHATLSNKWHIVIY